MDTEIAARLEALIADDEVDVEALLTCLAALPGCYKHEFVPATRIGALKTTRALGVGGKPVTGLPLCDAHDYLIERELPYAESVRRAVRLLIDLGEPPWWLEWAGVTSIRAPKTIVEVAGL